MALLQGDARHLPLRDRSVQCVVTSPPYWGLRDYGLGSGQLGLESTPDHYMQHLVEIFREAWRVLRDDGTMWLNLGDCYSGSLKGSAPSRPGYGKGKQLTNVGSIGLPPAKNLPGLKSKDLIGIPWRVALALQADGWYLRSDIIWAKPNPMPESVRDRPTRSHEYVFLLSKSERYYYDAHSIAEPSIHAGRVVSYDGTQKNTNHQNRTYPGVKPREILVKPSRNRRSVWFIPIQPYRGAHFATFPEKLVELCLLVGCPKGGIVLDPFCGSGTVVKVAEQLGRVGVGVEIKFEYLQLARVRVEAGLKRRLHG